MNRRTFLKSILAGAATIAAAPLVKALPDEQGTLVTDWIYSSKGFTQIGKPILRAETVSNVQDDRWYFGIDTDHIYATQPSTISSYASYQCGEWEKIDYVPPSA